MADIREVVQQMIRDYPKMGVSVRTGLAPEGSGFFVVDIDIKKGINGLESLEEKFEDFEIMDDQYLCAQTPSGGLHFPFQYPDGNPIKTTSDVLTGVDIRGDGGYITVEPSKNLIDEEWIGYQWNNIELPVSPCLPWVEKLLAISNERTVVHTIDGKQQSVIDVDAMLKNGVSEGARDESLFKLACICRSYEVDIDTATITIQYVADKCNPPVSSDIVNKKIKSAYSYQNTKTKTYSRDALTKVARGK